MPCYVYILLGTDNSFYVGHTEDMEKRLQYHNQGKGALYTANRLPVKLAYHEDAPTKSQAIAREKQLKRWTRAKKQALVDGDVKNLKSHSRSTATKEKIDKREKKKSTG